MTFFYTQCEGFFIHLGIICPGGLVSYKKRGYFNENLKDTPLWLKKQKEE